MTSPALAPVPPGGTEVILDPHVALAVGLIVLAPVIVFGMLLIPIRK